MDMQKLTQPVFWFPLLAAIALCYFFVDLPVSTFFDHIDQHHEWFSKIFSYINRLGRGEPYLFAAVIVWAWSFFIAKDKNLAWIAVFFFLTVLFSALLCDLLKILAGRARPYEYFSFNIYGFYLWEFDNNFWSFPSGHATTMGAVTSACYLVLKRWGKIFLILFLLIFFGRVICRAHYLSDVMAGGYLGFLSSFWIHHFLKVNWKYKNKVKSVLKE